MHKGFLKIGSLTGALSVILGAFGAHALKDKISDHAIAIFETGVRYQFFHALALLFVAMLYKEMPGNALKWTGRLFITGMIIFSGSLYILTFLTGFVSPDYKWIGAITPIGGSCLIAGWLVMFFRILKIR